MKTKAHIVLVAVMALFTAATAQNVNFGESFVLDSALNPNQSHEYTARDYIELKKGFFSEPSNNNYTKLSIDPFYNPPNNYGVIYSSPQDHDYVGRLGFYPMDFHVNEYGAATISIPLEFPEGINGMTPHLSLEYNSQAGNGIMGLGWSLGGMSKISRVPYTYEYNDESHSVQFSNEDQLSLDGVILRKGTYNENICYYPEIYDYSLVRPIADGFEVLKKDGLIYTYTARYYLQQALPAPIEWHLSRIEDTYGNQINYFYSNDRAEGSFYPDSICYTGRTGCVSAYTIRFTYADYDDRQDCPKKWFSQPGDNNEKTGYSRVTKKLSNIECWYEHKRIAMYNFSYTTLDHDIRALAYIEKSFHDYPSGKGDYNRIIPLKFVWENTCHNLQFERAGDAVDLNKVYNNNQMWYQKTVFAARFERNNLSGSQKYENDIVHLMYNDNCAPYYYLNIFRNSNYIMENSQVYSYYSYQNINSPSNNINNSLNDGRTIQAFMPADTDGDGLDEIVCIYTISESLRISLLKPDSNGCFFETTLPYIFSSPSSFDLNSFQIGDFNGDGLSDLFCLFEGHPHVRISAVNNPFSIAETNDESLTGEKRIIIADFSGDMRDQILVLNQTGDNRTGWFFRVAENGGSFSIPSGKQIIPDMAQCYFSNSRNRLCCGDFNGDGKKDILLLCSGAWRFYFSQGNGFFTTAQLMNNGEIVSDNFVLSSEDNVLTPSFAVISDFDHDGCDDISITLLQDFNIHNGIIVDTYKGAFRRDYLIRPTNASIDVKRIRNLRTWWENGVLQGTDRCIDSIMTNMELFSTNNVFFPVVGNHKGTSPNEILYCRMGNASGHSNVCAFLHNTGNFYPDSLTRAVSQIVTSLGASTNIKYRPVSYQFLQNENIYSLLGKALTAVLPYNGFMNIVEHVNEEIKDDGAGVTEGKKYRLTRYHYTRPFYHTRGRGFLGFGSVWSRTQGQRPTHDLVSVQTYSLDLAHHILVPEKLFFKHFRSNNTPIMDVHQQTKYTYSFLNNNDFANSFGQIPNGVFAPYLSTTTTIRNDGTPQRYEKTVTTKDGYGNITLFERKYGSDTISFPYYEKTETTYDNSITSNCWIIGVPKSETTTHRLTNYPVVKHTSYQNDMTHGRHLNKVTEPNSSKQLTETYGYDCFGNPDSVTRDIGDGNSRIESFTYSADGRFLTARTNAKGHTTHYYYHDATGLLDSVTDPNGLTTKYYYDYLCNLVKTELPSGIREEQEMKWVDNVVQHATYHPDTPPFGAPIYFVWNKRSGERERYTFYDQHRRKLREVDKTMDGKKIYVDYRYHDVTGLLDSVSAPYHPEEHETPQFSAYQYDYLNRNTLLTRPDGATMSHSFNGQQETLQGFDGQKRKLAYNPAGVVTKVSDYGNSSSSPIEVDYARFGDGKVKTSKVGSDNATTITYTYDANRNPATVVDPTLGELTYDYNGFGELVYSATPRDTVTYTYDALGHMVTRNGLDGYSHWQYDAGFKGALSQTHYNPVEGPTVTEYHTYDRLGNLVQHRQYVAGNGWTFNYGYDAYGHRNTVKYPSGKEFKWHYDRNGFMDRVTDASNNTVVWRAATTDRWGNTTEFTKGNIHVDYGYDPVTSLVTGISARKNGQTLFGQACSWTTTGNLEWRTDTTLNFREEFTYDKFNRLTSSTISDLPGMLTNISEVFQFDSHGNVMAKDGVGLYDYEHATNPYAVTSMRPDQLVIDHLADQYIAYTPFDKVDTIRQSGNTLTVRYGIDRQRVTQTFKDGKDTRTKRYFTPLYETETKNGVTKNMHYLTTTTGIFAIFVTQNGGGGTMYYTLKDHQGSLAATVHGNTVERLSYDPWGRRRNTTNFGYDNVNHTFDRGYTLHEHYDEFDLINMNGRLYDPILGRMLSPDIVIQDEQSSQAYNRYSYCFNNPLRFTDPSGYFVTIPPEFEKYYMPQYLDDFETYKTELEKMDAQNVAFNTELSEGKSVTTLTWTLGEDSYQMTIVDHGLKDYEQMCENSCVAAALAAQEARFTYGNHEITEEWLMATDKNAYKNGLYVHKVLPEFIKNSSVFRKGSYDSKKDFSDYENHAFREMCEDNGIFFRFEGIHGHVVNASVAIEFLLNNEVLNHEIRVWDAGKENGQTAGFRPLDFYDQPGKLSHKMGILFYKNNKL